MFLRDWTRSGAQHGITTKTETSQTLKVRDHQRQQLLLDVSQGPESHVMALRVLLSCRISGLQGYELIPFMTPGPRGPNWEKQLSASLFFWLSASLILGLSASFWGGYRRFLVACCAGTFHAFGLFIHWVIYVFLYLVNSLCLCVSGCAG